MTDTEWSIQFTPSIFGTVNGMAQFSKLAQTTTPMRQGITTPFLRGFLLNTLNGYTPKGFLPGPLLPGLSVERATNVESAGYFYEKFVIIIGTCVPTHHTGTQIAEALLKTFNRGEAYFHQELAKYAGRYAIIYGDQDSTKIVSDATAMRSVFYATGGGVAASHALLVEQAIDGTIRKRDMPFRYGFPGNATPYRRTKLLTPNTYYNLATNSVTRFWPTSEPTDCNVEDAATDVLNRAVQAIQNMASQQPLKMALTAGLDSRTMLAAMIQSGVDFETYTYGKGPDTLVDRNLASELAQQHGIYHTVIQGGNNPPELNALLEDAHYANHHKSSVASLEAWFGEPYSAAVTANLLEIGRTFYQHAKKAGSEPPITPEAMRNLHYRSTPRKGKEAIAKWGQDIHDYVSAEAFAVFLDDTEFQESASYIDPFDLFYWEHRMSAWHGTSMNERDFYAEPFIPFNARTIFETMLGVSEEKRQTADVLYSIINMVDPRLLDMPINPRTWPPESIPPKKLISPRQTLIPFTKNRDEIESTRFIVLEERQSFSPIQEHGISKYRAKIGRNTTLDALLVNQKSDVLIVSCHGALPRQTTKLPRFERLRTFLNTSYSSIYFGDPTIHLSDKLGLAWYTGWKEIDVYPIIAEWVEKAAHASGAKKIIFVGSSGGGFASLQISALIPESMAVPLNPQTAIWKYQPEGALGYARNYIKNVMPHLIPDGGVKDLTTDQDWSVPLGERASVIIRYEQPLRNYVYYAQNLNDVSHVTDHYQPFRAAVEHGPNSDRIQFFTYAGQHTHTSPKPDMFEEIMTNAIAWLETELESEYAQSHRDQ